MSDLRIEPQWILRRRRGGARWPSARRSACARIAGGRAGALCSRASSASRCEAAHQVAVPDGMGGYISTSTTCC